MSESPLVSVVVPTYNTDPVLLDRCLKGIRAQVYSEIETIVIDDGSDTDFAFAYDVVAGELEDVCIVHQTNGGVSAARNYGTSIANGNYIMYVDSDDVLRPHAVSQGVANALESGADVVIAGIRRVYPFEVGRYVEYDESASSRIVLERKDFDHLRHHYLTYADEPFISVGNGGSINRGPYCRLVKSEVARGNLFPTDLPFGEDVIWNLSLLDKCERVCVVNSVWYDYVTYDISALHRYRGDRIEIATRYLERVWKENVDYCSEHIDAYCRLIFLELYKVLTNELMSGECTLSVKEKNIAVRTMMRMFPWNMLCDSRNQRLLVAGQRALVLLCRVGLWIPAIRTQMRR